MKDLQKTTRKIIFILPLLLLVFSFTSIEKKSIKLISASSENWVSGINGGGKGTEYYLKILILSPNKIEFDSLWINHTAFKTHLANPSKVISNKPITFSENDTITVRVSESTLPKQPSNIQISVPPIKYKGEALLRYYDNGKAKYLVIKKINKKTSINRP